MEEILFFMEEEHDQRVAQKYILDPYAVDAYFSVFDDDDAPNAFTRRCWGKWDSQRDFAWSIYEKYFRYVTGIDCPCTDIEGFTEELFSHFIFVNGYVFMM